MIPIKTPAEIERMRASCRIAAQVLEELARQVAPGVNTYDLDQLGRKLIEEAGARSACYDYRLGPRRFPAYTCLSVNEEVVHGIGHLRRVLRPGDIITLDISVTYQGYIGDNARTVAVGPVSPGVARLLQVTEAALHEAIALARPGYRVGDISHCIQQYVETRGFSVIRDFVGHGVGRSMHEEPQIPNFGPRGRGDRLRSGMTLAIEPMVALGGAEIEIADDGWTALTRDRSPAAHFEHTVLLTEAAAEILTIPKI